MKMLLINQSQKFILSFLFLGFVFTANAQRIRLVKDINPGTEGSFERSKSGTSANYGVLKDKFVFSANDGKKGYELWVSDGTKQGTQLLQDIDTHVVQGSCKGSVPDDFISMQNLVFFNAKDCITGDALYATDGENTHMVHTIRPFGSSLNSFYSSPMVWNDKLYFVAVDGKYGSELWVSDGTNGGTYVITKRAINPNSNATFGRGSAIEYITNFKNHLYFKADDQGELGAELWRTDGTEAGTQLVKDINPASKAEGYPKLLTVLKDKLYFKANDGVNGEELWISDGTTAGTQLFKDIFAGNGSSDIKELFVTNNLLFFRANDGTHGEELWVSDGTTAGTQLLLDIRSGAASSAPEGFTKLGDKLCFIANDGIHGQELWISDGTVAGTKMVKDIRVGLENSSIKFLDKISGKLYFMADDGVHGNELWVTDGTEAGTQLVQDFKLGNQGVTIKCPLVFNNQLFFQANDGSYGFELYAYAPLPEMAKINSVSPEKGQVNDIVVITGNYFFDESPGKNVVKFNGELAKVVEATQARLVVKVPEKATTGKITVEANGLMATSAEDFTVLQIPTGLSRRLKSGDLRLFPNPVSQLLRLRLEDKTAETITIIVYNSQGQEILNTVKKLQSGEAILDVSALSTGRYLLKAYAKETIIIRDIIKK